MISYTQKISQIQQDTFKPKLTSQQLKQISQNGTFQVQSHIANTKIPYVWKINDWLMRGKVNIINIWQCGIGSIYSRIMDSIDLVITTIPNSLRKLSKIPIRLFSLIFGKKSLYCVYNPDHQKEVAKDFWSEAMESQFRDVKKEIGSQFLQLFYLEYQEAIYRMVERKDKSQKQIQVEEEERSKKMKKYYEKKQKINQFKIYLRELDNGFESMWNKIRKRVLTKISNQMIDDKQQNIKQQSKQQLIKNEQQKKKNDKIIKKLQQQKLQSYKNYIKQNLQKKQQINNQLIQQLLILIIIITIINSKISQKYHKLTQIKQQIKSYIQKKYTIRSKYPIFLQQNINQLYHPKQQKIQSEFYDGLLKEQKLQNYLNQSFKTLYQKYQTLRTNYQTTLQQKKKTISPLFIPNRTFRSTYLLLPPYEIKKQNGYYYLIKQKQLTIDTGKNYWKFKLYGMRLKTWTINCAIYLLYLSWRGVFGLRCLYGVKKFVIDEDIDFQTGQKKYIQRAPFLKVFQTVLQGVTKSRNHFQSLPDRGLFGKKFSRFFNYIECYVFRYAFVGVFLVLIAYPIAIIVGSLICIILVVSVWIWVPIILFVTYMFNILIFQFESFSQNRNLLIVGIPLLMLIIQITVQIIKCFAVILLFILGLFFSLACFVLLVIQRCWRKFTDKIMLSVIGYMGRTPSRDTAIAKKISGPGVSRSYFFSVLEEDVYVLTQCALQKTVMNKFVELTSSQIRSNAFKYQKIVQYTLRPFTGMKFVPSYQNIVIKNNQKLLQTFHRSFNNYMNRYPNYPSRVRFTTQQLSKYFPNAIKLVKNFIEKQNHKQWIFDERSIIYQDYNQLTRNIWIEIFNCGQEIFQPIQSVDCRVKLVDNNNYLEDIIMRDNVKSIVNALEGEIKLTTSQFQFCPGQKSLLERDKPIKSLSFLCDTHQSHSDLNILLDINNPTDLLVIPRNLAQLKRYDEWRYEQVMSEHGAKCQKGRVE